MKIFRLLDAIEICTHNCEATWFHLISYPQCNNIWCISYISWCFIYGTIHCCYVIQYSSCNSSLLVRRSLKKGETGSSSLKNLAVRSTCLLFGSTLAFQLHHLASAMSLKATHIVAYKPRVPLRHIPRRFLRTVPTNSKVFLGGLLYSKKQILNMC